jgi:short-subunit dehydrogenase
MALEAITDSLRREMLLFGVHVAMVNPGAVSTEIVTKARGRHYRSFGDRLAVVLGL